MCSQTCLNERVDVQHKSLSPADDELIDTGNGMRPARATQTCFSHMLHIMNAAPVVSSLHLTSKYEELFCSVNRPVVLLQTEITTVQLYRPSVCLLSIVYSMCVFAA